MPVPPRCFILSVPKAGTYLMSEVLRNCGLEQSFLHIKEDDYDDYKEISFEDGRRRPELARHPCPATEAIAKVGAGAFAVGHLKHSPAIEAALTGFRLVFLKRDLRDSLVSLMRFMLETGRAEARDAPWRHEPTPQARFRRFLDSEGADHMAHYRGLLPWNGHPAAVTLRFEDLVDPERALGPDALPAVMARFGLVPPRPLPGIVAASLAANTLTKSSGRSSARPFWDDWCEDWWRAQGGPALLAAYGYEARSG